MSAGDPVTLGEHVVWTWSTVSLADTGAGYGPIARSPRWPYDTRSDPTGGLGARVRFLDPGHEPWPEERSAPYSLAMDLTPEGIRVIRKQFLGRDSYGRNSRWLVHAMVFPPGTVGPVDVLAADVAAEFDIHVDDDLALRTDLPPVRLRRRGREPVPAEPVRRWREEARLLVAAVLAVARRELPGPVMVQAEESAHLAWMFELVFRLLPPAVAARLSFSTFESRPGSSRLDLVGCMVPFSEATRDGRPWLDLEQREGALPASPSGPMEAADVLIDHALTGRPVPERLADLEDLIRWAHVQVLRRRPPATLSTSDLMDLLADPETATDDAETNRDHGAAAASGGDSATIGSSAAEIGQTIWRAALTRLRNLEQDEATLLLRRLTVAAKGRQPTGQEEIAAGLVDMLADGLTAGGASFGWTVWREILDAVADLLDQDPTEVSRRVVTLATDLLREGDVPTGWEHDVPVDVVDRIVLMSTRLSADQQRIWLARPGFAERVAESWNPMAATLAVDALTGSATALPAFQLLLRRCTDDVAVVVDDLLERRAVDDRHLRRLAQSLPVSALPALFDALLAGRRVDRGFLLFDLLADPRLDDDRARQESLVPILHRHWPAIGIGAHLPPAVVTCLAVSAAPKPGSTGSIDDTVTATSGSPGGNPASQERESPAVRRRWGLRRS